MSFLPGILLVVLAVYCWIELAQSDPEQVRQLPRWIWALLIVVPLFGPVAWLVFGRPNGDEPEPALRGRGRADRAPTRQIAPDDDPEFLRSIRTDPPKDQ